MPRTKVTGGYIADGAITSDHLHTTLDLSSKTLTIGATTVSGHLIPDTNITYDLGSSTYRFRDIYLDGTTIDLGGTELKKNSDGDIEFKSGSNFKRLVVSELEFDDGTNRKKFKISSGRLRSFDSSGASDTADKISLSSNDTDDLSEGSSNLYFTTARARSSFSASTGIAITDGAISAAAVPNSSLTNSSVTINSNSLSLGGTLTLDTDDLSEGLSNLYFTNERVDDRVNALLTAGTGITLTYNDAANTLTIAGAAQYGDSDVESYLSGGTGVTFSSGVISIGQDVSTSATPTFGNTITGTLQATSFSDGTISGITFIDEDSFATNSATRVPTQQSIKAYVDAQVAGVVDSAPAALNTLNELAAALGDDANFSTTTSTALGNRLRVDTASQGLTGTQQANAITNLGITATKAELNVLDGITATVTELNYTDGVTSNIQTQLDGKLSTSGVAVQANNLNATDDRDIAPEDLGYSDDFRIYFAEKGGLETGTVGSNYQDVLVLNSYTDSSGGDANALAFDKSEKKIYHYQADQAATNWGTPKTLAYIDDNITGTSAGLSGTPNITVGTINSTSLSTTGNLDVDGIIDNTRNNSNVSAPSTSDHTAGTRIKLYDANATAFYAIGIENNTLWFNSDSAYKWYEDAVERMTLSSGGNLSIDGTLTASGGNSGNWNTAYGWGDHASAGYQTASTTSLSNYLRKNQNDTFTGTLTTGELQIFSSHPVHASYSGIANTEAWTTTTEQYMIISAGTDTYINGDNVYIRGGNNSSSNELKISTSGTTIGGNTVWHAGNDGSGSTLDADKLDGSEGAVYFKSPSDVSGWQNSSRNFSVRTGGDAVGLHMEQSNGTFGFQLYGSNATYGFLDGEWANWDIQKTANGAFKVDEGAGLKRVLNEANWSSYVTSVSGTSGGLSGSPNITVGTISSGAITLSNDSSDMGFGTAKAGSTVGHTASVDEGIFWHTTSDYGIYRTAGTWTSPNYSQLKLKWHTGIEIDGNGTSYGKSGINFLNGNIKMDGTQILDSSRNLRNIPLQNLGSTQAGSEHAVINIGRVGGGGETRAIDIIGSWVGGESKSITAVHGSSSTQIVGQINFIHDSPGSRMRFGKLYESGDSSVYPMILDGSSTTGASLDVTNDQHSTGNANRNFGTAASRKKKGAFHVKGGQGGTSANAYVTGITFTGADEDEAQAGLYCSQNSSTGTSLSLMCTNSYSNGPKEYFTVLDNGYCKVMANTLDVYNNVYANTKGSHYLVMGEDAYSVSSAYIGMKTSFQSGSSDYMIISGLSDGDTYVSAKNNGSVQIRGGGNNSNNSITVPDGSTITATTSDFRVSGNVTAYASDARLKTNIQTIKNPIEKIKKIRGVEFDWLDNIENFNPKYKHETGVIAQEIEQVIPDAVDAAPFNEEYKTVDKEKIVALLIEGIKEQQELIEKLTVRIEELEK